MKLAAIPKLARIQVTGTWYRALEPQFATSPLSAKHTGGVFSRFSPGKYSLVEFEILHLSETQFVCLLEVEALLGSKFTHVPNPGRSWLLTNVQIQLQSVVDLTSYAVQRRLGTTVQELTGDWEGYRDRASFSSVTEPTGIAPTQKLGQAIYEVPGLEGIRYVSAKVPDQMNLVIFPAKLLKGSHLTYYDPATGKTHRANGMK